MLMMDKPIQDLETARNDRSGFVNYRPTFEIMENIYEGVAGLMQLLANIDKGATFQSTSRDYVQAMSKLRNFGIQLGLENDRKGK